MTTTFIIPAFVAGLLMFLAPCTLPLVPGYLAFIGGSAHAERRRLSIFLNGLWYVIGFSVVFVFLGSIFGFFGATLRLDQREILSRIGGVFIVFFGLFLIGGSQWKLFRFLNGEKTIHFKHLQPGKPLSSFLFGATFAVGWTPCVGPILASILFLASTAGTAWEGALLLTIFAAGMGIPFLLLAATVDLAAARLKTLNRYLPIIQKIGGLLLIILGVLMATDSIAIWNQLLYRVFSFMQYEQLLKYY